MAKAATKKRSAGEPAADDYLDLVRRFPLRPIRIEADYDRALGVLRDLISRADHPGLTVGESDYADVLGRLVGEYDQRYSSILKQKSSPLEILKYIMDQQGMNTTDLGKLLGSGDAFCQHDDEFVITLGRNNRAERDCHSVSILLGLAIEFTHPVTVT